MIWVFGLQAIEDGAEPEREPLGGEIWVLILGRAAEEGLDLVEALPAVGPLPNAVSWLAQPDYVVEEDDVAVAGQLVGEAVVAQRTDDVIGEA